MITSKSLIPFLLAAASYLLGAPVWAADGKDTEPSKAGCAAYPAGDPLPIVAVCETSDALEFRRGNERDRYAKEALKREWHELITTWLTETNFPMNSLCNAQVTLWMSVPESNPLGAQLRLEVSNSHMPFVAFLPWEPKKWLFNFENTAILPEKDYPESFGFRVANILVKRRAHVTQERLNTYLSKFGLHSPQASSYLWTSYKSDPFTELDSLAELRADSFFSFHVEDATLNPVIEWIASRVKAYSYRWPCSGGLPSEETP